MCFECVFSSRYEDNHPTNNNVQSFIFRSIKMWKSFCFSDFGCCLKNWTFFFFTSVTYWHFFSRSSYLTLHGPNIFYDEWHQQQWPSTYMGLRPPIYCTPRQALVNSFLIFWTLIFHILCLVLFKCLKGRSASKFRFLAVVIVHWQGPDTQVHNKQLVKLEIGFLDLRREIRFKKPLLKTLVLNEQCSRALWVKH